MIDFANTVLGTSVPKGQLGVFFLGQAGFIFKLPSGATIALDPYLSDCCERYFGFKRLMAKIMSADDMVFDNLLITHAHYDHFDPDSIPTLMANGITRLYGAKDTQAECDRLNLHDRLTFMAVGDCADLNGAKVTAVRCDHGPDTPDALGFVIEAEEKKIYIMGDTAYRPDWLDDPFIQNPDLLILPINGAFGNLNEETSVKVIAALKPALSVPCHYWNFAQHFGNPGKFIENMQSNCPDQAYMLMRQGEFFLLK